MMKSQGAWGCPPAGLMLCDLEQFLSTSSKPDPTAPLTRGLHWPNPGRRCGRRKSKDRAKYLQGPETIPGGAVKNPAFKRTKTLQYQNPFCSVQLQYNLEPLYPC